jgi:hypothetical protein
MKEQLETIESKELEGSLYDILKEFLNKQNQDEPKSVEEHNEGFKNFMGY